MPIQTMTKHETVVLAGDIGGTKTRLAVFSSERGLKTPLMTATFPSQHYAGLEDIVQKFLSQVPIKVNCASFGVAGPVVNGQATITNLPWVMDEKRLAEVLKIPQVYLMNDTLASAQALPVLTSQEIFTLNQGCAAPGGVMAVIAVGTGLGETYLVHNGTRYQAYPSEGGHADFAPTTAEETRLLQHLLDRFEHVSTERVCSGIGIENIYNFLKETGPDTEPMWLTRQIEAGHDPVPVIVSAGLDNKRPCGLCQSTLNRFISILGAETGNLALKTMAIAGVYLGGGIPPRIVSALQNGLFMKAFRHKGRLSTLMETFPVHVILNSEAALLGAALRGLDFQFDG